MMLIHHLDVMRPSVGADRVGARAGARFPTSALRLGIFMETAIALVEVTGTMAAPGYPPRPPRLGIVGSRRAPRWAIGNCGCSALSADDATIPRSGTRPVSTRSSRISSIVWTGAPFRKRPTDNHRTLRLSRMRAARHQNQPRQRSTSSYNRRPSSHPLIGQQGGSVLHF